MPEETKHGMECAEFEALVSDALDGDLKDKDGRLSAARRESFEAHRRACAVCGPLFADAQAGRQWLRALDEVEPPAHLVHNILAATSGAVSYTHLDVYKRQLLDLSDHVVGVITWGVNLEMGQNLNFAAPCSEVTALLVAAHQQAKPLDSVANRSDSLTNGAVWTSLTSGHEMCIRDRLRGLLSLEQATQRQRPLLFHPLPNFRLDFGTMSVPPRRFFGFTGKLRDHRLLHSCLRHVHSSPHCLR